MLEEKLKLLPDKPGCYQMRNVNNEIIYVGKAKNLKKNYKWKRNLWFISFVIRPEKNA